MFVYDLFRRIWLWFKWCLSTIISMSSQWKCKFQLFCILFFRFNQIVVEKKTQNTSWNSHFFTHKLKAIPFYFYSIWSCIRSMKNGINQRYVRSWHFHVQFMCALCTCYPNNFLSSCVWVFLCFSCHLLTADFIFSIFQCKTVHYSCVLQPCLLNKVSLVVFLTHCLLIFFFTKKCLKMIFWHIETRLLQSSETTIKVGAYYTRRKGSNYLQRTRTTFANFAHLRGGSCDQNTLTLLKQSVFVVI